MSVDENLPEYSRLKPEKVYSRKTMDTTVAKTRAFQVARQSVTAGEQQLLRDISNIQHRLSLPRSRGSIKLVGSPDSAKESRGADGVLPALSALEADLPRMTPEPTKRATSPVPSQKWSPAVMAEFAGSEVVTVEAVAAAATPREASEQRLNSDFSIDPKLLRKIWVRKCAHLPRPTEKDHFLAGPH